MTRRPHGILVALCLLGCSEESNAPTDPESTIFSEQVSAYADDARYAVLVHDFERDDPRYESAWQALPFSKLAIEEYDDLYGLPKGPFWKLHFDAEGWAYWHGWKNSQRPGEWRGAIDLQRFALLCAAAEEAEVWSLEDQYRFPATHQWNFSYRFEGPDGAKRIDDYGEQSPASLRAYRALAMQIAEELEWEPIEGPAPPTDGAGS